MPFIPYTWDNRVYVILAIAWLLFAIVASIRAAKGKRSRILVGSLVGFFLTFMGYSVYIVIRQAKEKADDVTCELKLRTLGSAVISYMQASGEKFPPADHWDTAIVKYLSPDDIERVFHCPAAHSRFSYAYNAALSNKTLADVKDPTNTVVLFECDTDSRSAAGGRGQCDAGRHEGASNCVMVDGSEKRISGHALDRVLWDPSKDWLTRDPSRPTLRPIRSQTPIHKMH